MWEVGLTAVALPARLPVTIARDADSAATARPFTTEEYRDRGMIYINLECFRAALFDLQAYLKMLPVARDAETVQQKVVELQTVASRLN